MHEPSRNPALERLDALAGGHEFDLRIAQERLHDRKQRGIAALVDAHQVGVRLRRRLCDRLDQIDVAVVAVRESLTVLAAALRTNHDVTIRRPA